MAINVNSTYPPGRFVPPSVDYPTGSIKDSTTPALKDGSPLLSANPNDWQGFTDALLAEAGVTHSGVPDTALVSQRLQALLTLIAESSTIQPVTGGATLENRGRYLMLNDSANYTLPDTTDLDDGAFVELFRVGGVINPIIEVDGTNSEAISFFDPSTGALSAGPDTSARIILFARIVVVLRNENWEI